MAENNGAIIKPILMEREFDSNTSIWRKDGKDGRRSLTKINFDITINASNDEVKLEVV